MGFQISTAELPCLRNYLAASLKEQSISPIRGKTLKPLGKRRDHHMQIVRHNEGTDAESIACRLYNTDCVTFHKDGRIHLNHGGWVTNSTAQFIARITPHGYVYRKDGHMLLTYGGGTYIIPQGGLYVTAGTQVEGAEPCSVHTTNRIGAKRVRNMYKPFREYVLNMVKMLDGALTEVMPGNFMGQMAYLSGEVPEDLEVWYMAARQLMRSAGRWKWNSHHKQYMTSVTEAGVKRYLDNAILTYHNAEVFDVVLLPPGQYKKDTNRKYFY